MKLSYLFFLFLLLCQGCRIPQNKKKYETYTKIPKQTIEPSIIIPESTERHAPNYPHITRLLRYPPSVTKRSLQCKGNGSFRNTAYDCKGIFEHGLPLRNNKEFVQPCILEILNYLIKSSREKITIIEGHSCPRHRKYLYPENSDLTSKHLIGSAVTFIPGNLTERKLIETIIRFYKTSSSYRENPEYITFNRIENTLSNKEILLTIRKIAEGTLIAELEVLFDKTENVSIEVNETNIQNYLHY